MIFLPYRDNEEDKVEKALRNTQRLHALDLIVKSHRQEADTNKEDDSHHEDQMRLR